VAFGDNGKRKKTLFEKLTMVVIVIMLIVTVGAIFAAAFAYNQMQDLENSKMCLLKIIEIAPDFPEAYLHLGHMSKGDEAKKYLEKYIELQGLAMSAYLHLISLYKEDREYDKTRNLMQNVLTSMGISEETLFI